MKNKLVMMVIIIFASTATVAMERPNYTADELRRAKNRAQDTLENLYSRNESDFWINNHYENIRDSLHMLEFSTSSANTVFPDEVGRISNEDMKKLKHTFYMELQTISQEKAKNYIEKHIARGNFDEAARIINMQNKLCKNVIATEDFDCANLHETFKKLLADKIREKHESWEASIQEAPHKLEKDIQGIIDRSEKDVLYKKQQQQNLNKIWIDMNSGIL